MEFCFSGADILLPKKGFEKWAVIACDQFTSEPEYWEKVREFVGCDAYTSLDVILPEIYLKEDNGENIFSVNTNMKFFLENDIFNEYKDSLIFVDRTQSDGIHRLGIVGKIDLTQYDYTAKSTAAIRATEKTVTERIPPRVEIRKNALLELPHVMLLMDDKEDTVIKTASENLSRFTLLYDFDLMGNAGHIKGYLIDKSTKEKIISSLKTLSDKNGGFLFSVGDGNHSLATAKECYNINKTEKSRYALAEIVNIHSPALEFEPIYRLVYNCDPEKIINDFVNFAGENYGENAQRFVCVTADGEREISVNPVNKLAVGTLQAFLDGYKTKLDTDYIHGIKSLKSLAKKENSVGFLFDGMKKTELFPAVAAEGSLPRKTFSMGHALDKRFYIEARKIR